jgi:uncharacterized membrane protein
VSQLIVVAFDHLEDARTALKRLRDLESGGRVKFEDTALIERDLDGKSHVRNEASGTTETAAVIGAVLGGFLTVVFPIAGIVIGAAAGAAVGASLDTGASGAFVDEVKNSLQPGRSALFLVLKEADVDATIAALRDFRGDVIQSTLSSETEEALRQALSQS